MEVSLEVTHRNIERSKEKGTPDVDRMTLLLTLHRCTARFTTLPTARKSLSSELIGWFRGWPRRISEKLCCVRKNH